MKRGFTIVEIIISIGLIVLIGTISLVSFNIAKKNAKIRSLDNMSEKIYTAANVYIETNSELKDELYKNKNGLKIPLTTLENSGLIDFQDIDLTEEDYVVTMLGSSNPGDDHCAETYTAKSWSIKDEVIYICEKYDYSGLGTDVASLQAEVARLRSEIDALKSEVLTNTGNITTLQQTIASLQQTINILEGRITALEETKTFISLPAKWYKTDDNYIKYNGKTYNILKVDSDSSLTLYVKYDHKGAFGINLTHLAEIQNEFSNLLENTKGFDPYYYDGWNDGIYYAEPDWTKIICGVDGTPSLYDTYALNGNRLPPLVTRKDVLFVNIDDMMNAGQCISSSYYKLFNIQREIQIVKVSGESYNYIEIGSTYAFFKWHLKSCMKITSGTGAVENPYILENKC